MMYFCQNSEHFYYFQNGEIKDLDSKNNICHSCEKTQNFADVGKKYYQYEDMDKSNGDFFLRSRPICAQCANARDYLHCEAANSKLVDVLLKCEFCDKRKYCCL